MTALHALFQITTEPLRHLASIINNDYWVTNPSGYAHTCRAAILELTKKYSNYWMFNTSVTWSKKRIRRTSCTPAQGGVGDLADALVAGF
jgi:hypothetical protein